jgi:uncharacterized FlaG/YvyC family protein
MVTAINNIQPIVIKPFTEIPNDLNSQSKGLNPGKYNDLLKTLSNEIQLHGSIEKKDKESLSKIDFKELGKKLQSLIGDDNVTFEFSLDKETKKMILKLIDPNTKEVVQQFPSEIALKIARIVSAGLSNNGQATTNAKI